MEMGQGASMGLAQVVAEELNIDQDDIECVRPTTQNTPPFKMTVGSESISGFFEPVSWAAAAIREEMRRLASEKSGVQVKEIRDAQGGFLLPGGKRQNYADLVEGRPVILDQDNAVDTFNISARHTATAMGRYRAIGQNWRHHDLVAMVTGQPLYARDVSLPGMLYGAVVRPPVLGGKIKSIASAAAKKMPGVKAVVVNREEEFAGIVVQRPEQLQAAVDALEVTWEDAVSLDQASLDETLNVDAARQSNDFEHILAEDGKAPATSRQRITARYETPFATHGAMEPRAAVASVSEERAEVWCGSQDPFFVQLRVAKLIGRPAEDVTVHTHRMGGAFGGRVWCRAAEEAAMLSQATGKPVRVQWSRETEFAHNYFQPRFSHHIEASVDSSGLINQWEHDFVSSPIITGLVPENISGIVDTFVADAGTARGAVPPYEFGYHRIRYSDLRTAVPVGAWRGLGVAPNVFAVESMMDELAHVAGIDPLALRLKNLGQDQARLVNVLKKVAALSEWGAPTAPGVGKGIACAVYKDETYVATVAEIILDEEAQEVRVNKIWCVQDCGLMINPDQVDHQVVGNIVWGCSMAFKERISFANGRAEQRNFDEYEILRHDETPAIVVELVKSGAPPSAVGESALAPTAPAIVNAIFAAAKVRIRQLPIQVDDVFANKTG